jgi:hypothetical protein
VLNKSQPALGIKAGPDVSGSLGFQKLAPEARKALPRPALARLSLYRPSVVDDGSGINPSSCVLCIFSLLEFD